MEPTEGKVEQRRHIRPNQACPGCGEIVHYEKMGKWNEAVRLVWTKCKCLGWRLDEIIFVARVPGEPDDTRD